MSVRPVLSGICILLCLAPAEAQGQCSDAGACTISRHAEADETSHSQTLAVRYSYGSSGSPDQLKYHSVHAEATLRPFSESRLILILPFSRLTGPLGTSSGLGDIIAIWEQEILRWGDRENSLQVQAGMRLATGNANAKPGLPMTYQPGLGSNDVILGASCRLSHWTAGAAYQLAGARNDNSLIRLKRGDHVIAWASHEFSWHKTAFSPGVTIIKQVQKSSALQTAGSTDAFTPVPGSAQLQVNLAVRVLHEVSSSLGTELFAAIPLRPRDVNVDGLKRSVVLTLAILVTF